MAEPDTRWKKLFQLPAQTSTQPQDVLMQLLHEEVLQLAGLGGASERPQEGEVRSSEVSHATKDDDDDDDGGFPPACTLSPVP